MTKTLEIIITDDNQIKVDVAGDFSLADIASVIGSYIGTTATNHVASTGTGTEDIVQNAIKEATNLSNIFKTYLLSRMADILLEHDPDKLTEEDIVKALEELSAE